MSKHWDTLIKNALVFDGTGEAPVRESLALRDGRIAARGPALDETRATEVVDARGQWLMPGLLDIHTHLDLEVDLDPRLPEVVRHGTTTVLVGNCSLGTCFGKQQEGDQDPIVDCFTRVENIPKSVNSSISAYYIMRSTFPCFETNLLLLKYYEISSLYKENRFFNFHSFTSSSSAFLT